MNYFEIVNRITYKALPLFLASFANVGWFSIVLFALSRTTDDPYVYGAIGLGNMTLNMFLRSYVLGFNNSLTTLLSQAFGAGHFMRMGDIINRSKILFTLWMIPILAVLFFLSPILQTFGQNEEVSENTQYYVRISMFAFIPQLYFDIYRKILNSQRLFHVHGFVPYVTLVLHIIWWYYFITYLELGILGAGLWVLIQSTTNFAIIYSMVHLFGYGKEAIKPIRKEVFEEWTYSLKLGVPTFFLQFFAFISIEIIILLSGIVSPELLVANTIWVNMLYLLFLYVYSVQMTWWSWIGNKIGEGSKVGAEKLINANLIFAISFSIFIIVFFHLFKSHLYFLYTTDPNTHEIMHKISIPFSFVLVGHMMKEVVSGILIGLGLQDKTMWFNISSYMLVGIPISAFWTFYLEWIYYGPWIGIAIAMAMTTSYFYYLFASQDIQVFIDEYKRKHGSELTDRLKI